MLCMLNSVQLGTDTRGASCTVNVHWNSSQTLVISAGNQCLCQSSKPSTSSSLFVIRLKITFASFRLYFPFEEQDQLTDDITRLTPVEL